jgi:hypothetical protein
MFKLKKFINTVSSTKNVYNIFIPGWNLDDLVEKMDSEIFQQLDRDKQSFYLYNNKTKKGLYIRQKKSYFIIEDEENQVKLRKDLNFDDFRSEINKIKEIEILENFNSRTFEEFKKRNSFSFFSA